MIAEIHKKSSGGRYVAAWVGHGTNDNVPGKADADGDKRS